MTHLTFRLPVLCPKDKRPCLYYYAWSDKKNKLIRYREYFARIKSPTKRKLMMDMTAAAITSKLISGWTPEKAAREEKGKTLLECLTDVLDAKARVNRERSTKSNASRINGLKRYLASIQKIDMFPHEFSKAHAQLCMDFISKGGQLTGRTLNNYISDYKSFFNGLVNRAIILDNPFKSIRPYPEQDKKRNLLTLEDLNKIASHFHKQNPYFNLFINLLFFAGIRPKEIQRMKFSDFDLDKKIITIRPEVSKTKKFNIIPMAEVIYEQLITLNYPPYYYIYSNKGKPGETLRDKNNGIYKTFKTAVILLNIDKDITFYSLKDSIASLLITGGKNIREIQLFFRHEEIKSTEQYIKKFNPLFDKSFFDGFPKIMITVD